MADYEITIARSALRELSRLPSRTKTRITGAVEDLGATPRPRGVEKLTGYTDLYRIRVGQYRIIYRINDDARIVNIVRVRTRGAAYRL